MRNKVFLIILIIITTVILFIADMLTGSSDISLKELISVISGNSESEGIINTIKLFRIPRVLTALLSGSALTVSGLLMQTLFRNPLAGPYILGISSGASLGVALTVFGAGFFTGGSIAGTGFSNFFIIISGAIGAGLIMLIISMISIRQKDIMTLLIMGVLIGSVVSAIVGLLQYLSKAGELKLYVLWTMGSLRSVSPDDLKVLLPVILTGLIISVSISRHLNIILLGEDNAKAMGTPIKSLRLIIFVVVSLLAGSITAFCGPIGFIGIAVPHIVRTIFKSSDHRLLVPVSIITGAAVMLFSDILSNFGPEGAVIPINSITALIGIPFIFWLIFSKKKTFFNE